MKKPLDYPRVLSKAMRFCAYQERCIVDLKLKNREWALNVEEFEELVSQLQQDNFLNEDRFAESYVRGKFKLKRWGKLKIRQGLYSKNISSKTIDEKLKLISDEDYRNNIGELLEKKLQQLEKQDDKKLKIQRYLLSKGYELEEILEVYNEIER